MLLQTLSLKYKAQILSAIKIQMGMLKTATAESGSESSMVSWIASGGILLTSVLMQAFNTSMVY